MPGSPSRVLRRAVSASKLEERTCFPGPRTPITSSTDPRLLTPSIANRQRIFNATNKQTPVFHNFNNNNNNNNNDNDNNNNNDSYIFGSLSSSSSDLEPGDYQKQWKSLVSIEREHNLQVFQAAQKKLGETFASLIPSIPPGTSYRPKLQLDKPPNDNLLSWPTLYPSQRVILSFKPKSDGEHNHQPQNPSSLPSVEGFVASLAPYSIQINLAKQIPPHLMNLNQFTVSLQPAFDEVLWKRMQLAIDTLSVDTSVQSQRGTDGELSDNLTEPGIIGSGLADILLPIKEDNVTEHISNTSDILDNALIRSWALRYSREGPALLVEGDPKLDLNRSQLRAIARSILHRVSLVQGPPGTGKTKTIVAALQLLKKHFALPHLILVCAPTHTVTDNLLQKSADLGLNVLRLGRVREDATHVTEHVIEHKIKQHPRMDSYETFNKERNELHRLYLKYANRSLARGEQVYRRKLNSNSNNDIKASSENNIEASIQSEFETKLDKMVERNRTLHNKLWGIKNQIMKDIYAKVDVVFSTCSGASGSDIDLVNFPIVMIDEAAQASEPTSLIPLMKGSKMLTLVGDHKQLSHVVSSPEAKRKGYTSSLFERLKRNPDIIPSTLLDTQYRMLPRISEFSNRLFYSGALYDNPHEEEIPKSAYLANPNVPISFVHSKTKEYKTEISNFNGALRSNSSISWTNVLEANLICTIVEDLLVQNPDMKGHQIGIISAYAAQTQIIQERLGSRTLSKLRLERRLEANKVQVSTVDGYQGREKDVIIFSTVRSNPMGNIGFLKDQRRLNVALTRARRALFVVGNADTLERSASMQLSDNTSLDNLPDLWKRYIYWIKMQGALLDLEQHQRLNRKEASSRLKASLPADETKTIKKQMASF